MDSVRSALSVRLARRRLLRAGAAVGAGLLLAPSRDALAAPAHFDADVGLDAGHSRVDVGASGGGFGEYQHTLDIAERIKPLLEGAGLTVNLSRTNHEPLTAMSHPNADRRTEIEQSARIAAVGNVRIYVSIHFNGGPPSLRGTETYYNDETAGPDSRRLAMALQRSVVAELAEYGYATADRGAKSDLLAGKPYGHFFSLRGSMPSTLVEGLFLSNPTEADLLLQEDARQALARGYVGGIVAYFAGG
jgi:N-acetylmuramoyl-L-alanine amidase